MHLLDQEAPGLVKLIEELDVSEQRHAIAKFAIAAGQRFGNLEPAIRDILADALNRGVLSQEQLEVMRAYMDSSDDTYFTLQEQGKPEREWRSWFEKARLAAAIVASFDEASGSGALDAAYELCFTSDDKLASIFSLKAEVQNAKRSA